MNCELLQNLTVFLVSILVCFGLIIFYWKIWSISKKIKKINTEIENQKNILNNKEIKSIQSDQEIELQWAQDNKKEKQEKRKIEHKIEKLEREKKYLLEKISIYKLFKK